MLSVDAQTGDRHISYEEKLGSVLCKKLTMIIKSITATGYAEGDCCSLNLGIVIITPVEMIQK